MQREILNVKTLRLLLEAPGHGTCFKFDGDAQLKKKRRKERKK